MSLFYENPYAKSLDGKSVIAQDLASHSVVLEETIFFPQGGGQPGDIGSVEWQGQTSRVINTVKDKGQSRLIIEQQDSLPSIGETVVQRLDWSFRYPVMQMHSSLHLLCACIPFGVTGGNISPTKSRLDFDSKGESMPDKQEISDKINSLIQGNFEVSQVYTDWKFLDNNPDIVRTLRVQPPRTSDTLRLIRIGNENTTIDLQPCGGTHLKTTIEIPEIKVSKIENKGQQNKRVYIVFA